MRPPSGWSSVVLAGLMMLTVAWAVQKADYAPGLDIVTPVVVGGVVAGAVLGTQRWMPATLAHAWSILGGIAVTAILGTRTLDAVGAPAAEASRSLLERLVVVRDWYLEWVATAAAGRFARDELVPFAFVLTMALLLWLLSYICVWFVVRYLSWWGAVLPSGFALATILYAAPEERLVALGFFLACALLLAGQLHVTLQIYDWQRRRIGYGPGVRLDFLRDAALVVLAVVALAWLAPIRPGSARLSRLVDSFTASSTTIEQRFNQLFPDLNYPVRDGGGQAFGTEMALGGSIALGNRAIFDAEVEGAAGPVRYFRMATFDAYDGRGWRRTVAGTVSGGAYALDLARDARQTAIVTQTIRAYLARTEQLYAMPEPELFSIPVRAEIAGEERDRDVVAVYGRSPLVVGDTYRVVSRESVATTSDLGGAVGDDPASVRERYIALPPELPARIGDMARMIGADLMPRYAGAAAIESFLRTNLAYSQTIDDPPPGRDLVDWFLFEQRRGYCDYFSSAFVVLARASGIPARLAAGYSAGERQPETGVYRQHESDAHTWPEVYFPDYGWIAFEPTAGDDPIARPGATASADVDYADFGDPAEARTPVPDDLRRAAPGAPDGPGARQARTGGGVPWLVLGVLTAVVALAGGSAVWWRRPLSGLSAAAAAYARMSRIATWIGLSARRAETPAEYADRLGAEFPAGRADIDAISGSYVEERYGRRPSAPQAAVIGAAWRHLRAVVARSAIVVAWRNRRR